MDCDVIAAFYLRYMVGSPAARPITPRAPHTGGGGYPFKTGGRKTPITLVSPGRDYRLID